MKVHAFDEPETILGQGTVDLELSGHALDTLYIAVAGEGIKLGVRATTTELQMLYGGDSA